MADPIDLAVIGAGPAGMAAATLAAELGLSVAVLDEQDAPGGQIYRAIERAAPNSPLGPDYLAGRDLAAAFRASRAVYRPATTVWHIDPDGAVSILAGGRSETFTARRILLATGAYERPIPIPGWTLPGVMTVGAAQILLKTADLVPGERTVLGGQGPLLFLAAAQLLRAGAPPAAILETAPHANYHAAAACLGPAWAGRRQVVKGLGLIAELRRAGIPIRRNVRGLRALGRDRVEAVAWDGGELPADHLLLHEGVIPNTQVSLALGLAHDWDEAQRCWRPSLDQWGNSSVPTIAVAGDGGGIAGAAAAPLSGRLAALAAATMLGRLDAAERERRARPIHRALARELAFRPFLDALYRPSPAILTPPDDTVTICRCEEVTAGMIRRAARLGAQGPNQAKAFTRCGMGPCQGRLCGPLATAIMAETLGRPIPEIGTYRPRAPYKPITVGALAGLAE
ncbi:MAG TPA: NAD(P)/FAD-dependent oxidoreductase [Stellaceae bacterium]|jgi:NADPH-dependent 2,4-dienoyl-CoA reductase/sulfur reductase-like enzyme|nr:NAD(P)/FAD-dependent oxidoreductase [Stellaceae bacterium]